jgi:hypothetical protein
MFQMVLVKGQSIHRSEFWGAYFLRVELSQRFSVWNDFHFVPGSFFISRHGLSFHAHRNVAVTGGYAWLMTATPFSGNLIRFEHRPWGQIESIMPMFERSVFRFRIRYDYRIRRNISDTEILNGYNSYSRIRFMNSIRFPLLSINERQIDFNVMNETLLNFGRQIRSNNLDQNRIWLLFGFRIGNLTLIPGYEMRYIPGSTSNAIHHGAALWLLQSIATGPR